MTPGYENLVVDQQDAVLWVRIARPRRRNALSRATLAELGTAFRTAAPEPALKAAVLTGSGEEAFAAGGDLKEFAAIRGAEQAAALFDEASAALDEIRRFPVPVVAAINGVALGGGAELALACDFRVAAAHARIGYIHARLAISPGFGGGADLVRRLGASRALRHCLSAEALDAREALGLGMIDEIAREGESLEQCVARLLGPMVQQRPQAIRAYKAIALAERFGPADGHRNVERAWFAATWSHPDHWVAVEHALKPREGRTS